MKATRIQPAARERKANAPRPPNATHRQRVEPLDTGRTSSFWRLLLIACGLIAVNLFVYGAVLQYGFLRLDDPQYVTENPHVTGGLTWPAIVWAVTSGYAANWHPVTWLSHMLDVQIYGMNAAGHHLTNLLLHVANTLLLFGWLHRTTRSVWRSGCVAILFAVHPLHVESVAWIAERKDVLSTFFWMLTISAYVSYAQQPRTGRYFVVLVLFVLGLMAKPMVVTLPLVLLLLDVWPLGRCPEVWRIDSTVPRRPGVWKALVTEKLPFIALAVASGVVTIAVQRQWGAVSPVDSLPLTLRVANALVSYAAYIGKTLWPLTLAAFYPYQRPLPVWSVAGSFVALCLVSILSVRQARQRPYLLVGWAWYVVTLVPVIGLVQVGGQAMADRYTYIPLIGLFLMVAWGVPDLFSRTQQARVLVPVLAALAIAACAVMARVQTRYWESGMALWGHALSVTRDNYVAHTYVGNAFASQGNMTEAIAHYNEALRIRPDAEAHNNLGRALAGQGQLAAAIAHFSEALRLNAGPDAHNNLGVALATQGRLDEAIGHYREALRLQPDHANAHGNLGLALARQGHIVEAINEFEAALRIKPGLEDARRGLGLAHTDLANASLRRGAFSDAIAHYREALRIEPGLAEAHNGLGAAFANDDRPDDAIREFAEAVRLRPNAADFRCNLAAALEQRNKVAEAVEQLEAALRIDPNHSVARRALERLRAGTGR